jgi:hypothetical protein
MTVNYCTLAQVKGALRITDTIDDSLLNTSIEAASRWIDGYTDRSFGSAVAGTAFYIPTGRMDDLAVDDLTAITSIAIDEELDKTFATTLNPIDFQALPVNARSGGIPFPFSRVRPQEDGYWPISFDRRATVRVIGDFGWPGTPVAVREAAILQASRLYTRLSSPVGVVSFGDMGAIRVSRFVDPDVDMLLNPYKRVRF